MNLKTRKHRWLILPLALFIMAGCEKVAFEPVEISNDSVSFAIIIQPILDNNCVKCHPPTKGLDLNAQYSYDALVPGYASPADSANPQESKLYSKLTGTSHTPRTSDIEKQRILKWIEQGVRNN